METYRSELDKLDTYFENGKLHHSVLSIGVFKILFWIKKFLGKKDGYIDWMSKDYNCQVMTDIIQVLNIIVVDTIDLMEMQLAKPQFEKFKQLEKISRLIINNFDKPIRSNPHIIYGEDCDDNQTLTNGEDCDDNQTLTNGEDCDDNQTLTNREDSEESNSDIDCNLINVLESLLQIDNYLEEELINS